ncbi:SIS domain-containing protein [Xylariaceae sp. FL0016]|nr:SIS domain-containing protein [Xylariaceae sp. FL0016]
MVEHHPVHNSEVYLLGLTPRPTVPPPSPPSPGTPTAAEPNTPIEDLCLDDTEVDEDGPSQSSLKGTRISGAIHVLNTEATALRRLTQLYKTETSAANGFNDAVEVIVRQSTERGKVVIIGIGKSGHIGKKLVATFNSLGLHATFLHPTEALHGDLGKIRKHDVVLFITFSGKTPELLTLLPHIDDNLPIIVLTKHENPSECELVQQRPDAILLPAPIHESETVSFGVSAPTTSTTVALALGDALAVVISQELFPSVSSVFSRNHPGGAIGAAFAKHGTVRDIAIPLSEIPQCPVLSDLVCGADVLRCGYDAPSGWVCYDDAVASPGRIRGIATADLARKLEEIQDLFVPRRDWMTIDAETRLSQAREWLRDPALMLAEEPVGEHAILAVVSHGDVIGVLEAGELLRRAEE